MAVDGPEDPDVRRAQVSACRTHALPHLTTSQDVRLVPEENGAPPVVPQVRIFSRSPNSDRSQTSHRRRVPIVRSPP